MKKENFNPQAYLCLTNGGGISIELNNTGEAVKYQCYDKQPSCWCKIYYTSNGDAYFKINGRRYHLYKFLRISI